MSDLLVETTIHEKVDKPEPDSVFRGEGRQIKLPIFSEKLEYVRAVARLVTDLGIPTMLVIVGGLVFVGLLQSPITETRDMLKTHMQTTEGILVAIQANQTVILAKISTGAESKNVILRRICRNTAKDQFSRDQCDEVGQ